MTPDLQNACNRFKQYYKVIFQPAMQEFVRTNESSGAKIHQVFSMNLFVAHALDYILAVRRLSGISGSRTELIKVFDEKFSVQGGRFQNRKFELIDGINNALKHIELDRIRYETLTREFGTIAFSCLVEHEGRTLCILEDYRFDYSSVILRPVIEALSNWVFEDAGDVLDFASGDFLSDEPPPDDHDGDPIDEMIAHVNPVCNDCGEGESSCRCETYIYKGQAGAFAPSFNAEFDFHSVMSRISGSYKAE